MVEAGDRLCAEGHVDISSAYKAKYAEIGEIRKELRHKTLAKASAWTKKNETALEKQGSDIPFTLHKLQVLSKCSTIIIVHPAGKGGKAKGVCGICTSTSSRL